jgi:hypothetical protein
MGVAPSGYECVALGNPFACTDPDDDPGKDVLKASLGATNYTKLDLVTTKPHKLLHLTDPQRRLDTYTDDDP